MEWGVKENHVAVTALHNCGKSHYQIFKLLKPLTVSQMFIYWAIKHYKELWRVHDRAQPGHLKIVSAEAAIKTVWEWIHRNPLWKQKIMSQKLNILTQSSCASSGMTYTWESTSVQRDTTLLPSHFLRHGLGGGFPIRGATFIFARKGWNWCLTVSRGRAIRSCETS